MKRWTDPVRPSRRRHREALEVEVGGSKGGVDDAVVDVVDSGLAVDVVDSGLAC